ncbi:DNA repair protein recA1, chloroplastic [Sesamum alatum]|uniref:DNA repair protein recA1, chloroplastic n=1 Tax=Sesamum alatum TaxID=300844 RepID=A0AAE1Z0G2_9LAMI|nr:DNA repair protein recA1, chloroplastic [Sesamum alatum]
MALEIADRMCRSGAVDLICIDSVSALTPRAEIEGEIGMQQMGLQARLMSQALRKMSGNASKAGCTLVFLNQIRYKFFASVRLEIRPIGKIKSVKGDEDVGLKVRGSSLCPDHRVPDQFDLEVGPKEETKHYCTLKEIRCFPGPNEIEKGILHSTLLCRNQRFIVSNGTEYLVWEVDLPSIVVVMGLSIDRRLPWTLSGIFRSVKVRVAGEDGIGQSGSDVKSSIAPRQCALNSVCFRKNACNEDADRAKRHFGLYLKRTVPKKPANANG